MTSFQQLWAVAEREAARHEFEEPDTIFGPLGLFLLKDLENWDYNLTPLNTLAFATTGGDGVHYNLLCEKGAVPDDAPIVMTVPCAEDDNANIIVGENLFEFLCLGCRFGYFGLEDLAYDPEETIEQLQNPPAANERDDRLLAILRNEFSLRPWANVEGRLAELREKYHPLLEMRLWEE